MARKPVKKKVPQKSKPQVRRKPKDMGTMELKHEDIPEGTKGPGVQILTARKTPLNQRPEILSKSGKR
jgi:hypothetical protein